MTKKVVLAYSGGLDTSVAIRWMMEEWGVEVVAVLVDVGQDPASSESFEEIRERAMAAGASECVVVDARDEMAEEFCARAIAANALYEGRYPLVSALSRPVIVRHLVDQARRHDATAVAHGCTGKGNDQVRFEVGVHALAPDLEVLAPARNWGMTRADSVDFAQKWDIPIRATREKIYSIDENLWGRAIECGAMEDPWAAPPEEPYTLTRVRTEAPVEVVVGFTGGVPRALDGETMALAELIGRLNALAGATGFGRLDMVENRRVGIKSREVYECPAALALIAAHEDLESLVLERDLAHEKRRLETRWAELVYDGMWFSPLKEALDAFVAETQRHVTGEVRLTFTPPGVATISGRRSPAALYDYGLATYEAADTFRHADSEGFVRIYGLGVKTWAQRQGARDATPRRS
ncbi:MAG TPA: argininosuccinate synthase [Acidimicrobiales bacterium]|nr:MAG: argininosuccinate synthase [Actinobacteria bacterium 21-73-9]HQU26525.1 argininosuccinate synthase [Acidimicrobiales bacterium]